jgi:ketosteroid isomerase-like protein
VADLAAREAQVRETLTALGSGRLERFIACLTPDAVLEDPLENGARGSSELAAWMQVRHRAFPQAAYEPLRILLTEDVGAVEWHARLRDAAGREYALTGVAMLDFERDRISHLSLYYDVRALAGAARRLRPDATPPQD